MKKQRSVSICTGGGGRALPVNLGVEDTTTPCHPELDSGSIQRCQLSVSLDRFRNKFGMTVKVQCDRKRTPSLRADRSRRGNPVENVTLVDWITTSPFAPRDDRGVLARAGFTMAEILLSLTIIGVVAAITLPSLTGNINERTWNTQRKALYARFSQALALMPALNGYGTLKEETDSAGSTSIEDTAAETFVTAGLSKVLKINNICDSEHLEDCGIPSEISPYSGDNIIVSDIKTLTDYNSYFVPNNYKTPNTKAAAFETANGESILVYYNPKCVPDMGETTNHSAMPKMCANFIYDLNGSKGPNSMGKDIGFITALYPTDSVVVAPMPMMKNASAAGNCMKDDSESRIPNRDELSAMFYNNKLIGMQSGYWYASGTVISEDKVWGVAMNAGARSPVDRISTQRFIRCIKR